MLIVVAEITFGTSLMTLGIACYDLSMAGLSKLNVHIIVMLDNQLRWTSVRKQSNEIQWNDELYLCVNQLYMSPANNDCYMQ
jgi:hypothetical protein